MLKKESGDLVEMAKEGKFDIIIHGCNCFCAMGAGIAKTIKEEFPSAYEEDLKTVKGDKSKLGTYSISSVELKDTSFYVINAYTQYSCGSGVQVDYEAIRSVFEEIKVTFYKMKIGIPKIGAGLGGGDWNIISSILESIFKDEFDNITVIEFDEQ